MGWGQGVNHRGGLQFHGLCPEDLPFNVLIAREGQDSKLRHTPVISWSPRGGTSCYSRMGMPVYVCTTVFLYI